MIDIRYDKKRNTVVIEFSGKIDAAQGKEYLPKIPAIIPKNGKGFNLLVDASKVESIDPKLKDTVTQAMDIFNKQGVKKVIRVIPDPHQDIGFNILSVFHYSKDVKIVTVESRDEAEIQLEKYTHR